MSAAVALATHESPALPATAPAADAPSVVRVATAGSVDDGKSTLIGRLLHDCKALFRDQLDHVEQASRRRGFDRTELALLTDGLRAEREQGITIDVAWRYFVTARARFVLADTPGHVQYTRNMVTGASHADIAVILVDAERGTTEQSRRHLSIAAMLRVPRVVVAINKMDRVGFAQARFAELASEVRGFAEQLRAIAPPSDLAFVPIAALGGDNVVTRSPALAWYQGPTLLELLEAGAPRGDGDVPARFAVQWVIRPQREDLHHYRGLAGRVVAGTLRVGDPIVVLPSGVTSRIARLELGGRDLAVAPTGRAITVHLGSDVDVARGDLLAAAAAAAPTLADELSLDVCVLAPRTLAAGDRVLIKHQARQVRAVVTAIDGVIDVTTGDLAAPRPLALNDLGRISVRLAEPLAVEPYAHSRALGSCLVVDDRGDTVAGGMIR